MPAYDVLIDGSDFHLIKRVNFYEAGSKYSLAFYHDIVTQMKNNISGKKGSF